MVSEVVGGFLSWRTAVSPLCWLPADRCEGFTKLRAGEVLGSSLSSGTIRLLYEHLMSSSTPRSVGVSLLLSEGGGRGGD